MQTLVRSMPDFHKTLILANVRKVINVVPNHNENQQEQQNFIKERNQTENSDDDVNYVVDEIAMATEHAPFRHKKASERKLVGSQTKNSSNNNKKQKCMDKEEGTK